MLSQFRGFDQLDMLLELASQIFDAGFPVCLGPPHGGRPHGGNPSTGHCELKVCGLFATGAARGWVPFLSPRNQVFTPNQDPQTARLIAPPQRCTAYKRERHQSPWSASAGFRPWLGALQCAPVNFESRSLAGAAGSRTYTRRVASRLERRICLQTETANCKQVPRRLKLDLLLLYHTTPTPTPTPTPTT